MGVAIIRKYQFQTLRCHTRSAAVCQFAQHYAAAEMILTAVASTVSMSVTVTQHSDQ